MRVKRSRLKSERKKKRSIQTIFKIRHIFFSVCIRLKVKRAPSYVVSQEN